MIVAPFTATCNGKSVAGTDSSLTAVVLPTGAGNQVRVVNEGPNVCFFALGAAGVTATLPTTGNGVKTCVAVLAGEDIILTRSPLVDLYISTICRSGGTATLSVYVGEGA